MANVDAALREQVLDVAQAKRETDVHRHHQAGMARMRLQVEA